tara:strand:+ start:246 stop:668 length:423 start_codon:yes stop_codon:yes gene_type:complete
MSSYTENLLRKKIIEDEARLRKGPKKKVVEEERASYQPKSKVKKPKKDSGASFSEKLGAFTQVTGIDPIQNLLEGPSRPDIDVPDLTSEIKARVEQQKARIASAPKMFPMYYERANEGKFFNKSVKVKCKLGRNKKTKIY